MSEDGKIVDLEAAKDRLKDAELTKDAAQWWELTDKLFDVMTASGFPPTSLTSVVLRALIDALKEHGATTDEAKELIPMVLKYFRR